MKSLGFRWTQPLFGPFIVALLPWATSVAPALGGGAAQVAPYTSEATQRGLIYPIMTYPPISGFYGFGCGFADFDGDGDPDVVVLGSAAGKVGIFENLGGGQFADRTATSGIPPMTHLSAFATADYDGDGDVDLFVARIFMPSRLYRNEGSFTFVDVTAAAGITTDRLTKGVCWGDYDGDGWVDLFLCNYFFGPGGPGASDDQLWRNQGDGTFVDVAPALGMASHGAALQAVWSDVDRDGDLDLYVSNDRGTYPGFPPNLLYRNDGGSFAEVGAATGTNVALNSMGLACGDFDGDGLVDFYCTNTTQPFPPMYAAFPLLLSQPDGTWVQAQEEWGVAHPGTTWGWGAMFFDWNNDGRLDLYVCNQFDANDLFQNNGVAPAENVTEAAQIEGPFGNNLASYSAAYADVDGDGGLDVLLNTHGGNVSLFINNEGRKRGWVTLRVLGVWPNSAAIGANATIVHQGPDGLPRSQFGEIYAGGNGYLGQNEQVLHFGLGEASTVDAAEVRWPSNGPVRNFTSMPINVRWTIYPPHMLGDANLDGVVDDVDRVLLCGLRGPVMPGTEMLDFDGDFVIGSADWSGFQTRFELAGARWADLDGSGAVDGADLGMLLAVWGTGDCLGDLDGDGEVGGADLGSLLGSWSL